MRPRAPPGFARPRPAGLWQRWFGGAALEVHEYEDESLLCVIRPGRFPHRRLVYDADGAGRGGCAAGGWRTGAAASSPCGRPAPNGRRVPRPGRPAAGDAAAGAGRAACAFTEAAADPFAKMLVLAAALRPRLARLVPHGYSLPDRQEPTS